MLQHKLQESNLNRSEESAWKLCISTKQNNCYSMECPLCKDTELITDQCGTDLKSGPQWVTVFLVQGFTHIKAHINLRTIFFACRTVFRQVWTLIFMNIFFLGFNAFSERIHFRDLIRPTAPRFCICKPHKHAQSLMIAIFVVQSTKYSIFLTHHFINTAGTVHLLDMF